MSGKADARSRVDLADRLAWGRGWDDCRREMGREMALFASAEDGQQAIFDAICGVLDDGQVGATILDPARGRLASRLTDAVGRALINPLPGGKQ